MMIKLPLLFLLIPFSVFCQTAAKVVGISDGDTITVLLEQHFAKNLKPQSFQNQGIALFFLYFSQVRGLSRTLK